jgi:hypothetical protein
VLGGLLALWLHPGNDTVGDRCAWLLAAMLIIMFQVSAQQDRTT